MSETFKANYAVDAEKTAFLTFKRKDKVSDILLKIQKKENDKEYKHLFYEGAEIGEDEDFYDYYEPTTVYIATKEAKIPKSLELLITEKTGGKDGSEEEDEAPVIDEDDAIDFDSIPEPDDVIPDLMDTGKGIDIPEPPDIEPKSKKKNKKGIDIPEPPIVEPKSKKKDKKGIVIPEPPIVEPKEKKKKAAKGKKYRVFTTLTFESMLKGHNVEGIDSKMEYDDVKDIVLSWIKKESSFKGIYEDKSNIEVHLYLPCGAPFLGGTISEWTTTLGGFADPVLYAVVTRKLKKSANKIIKQICDCSNDEMQLLLSPICDSTPEGYTQIASLLGYFYYGGSLPTAENLLRSLATMTGFAPMINSIYTIMVREKINGLMIASITACLQTFIAEKVTGSNLTNAFSYTNALMSYINSTKIKLPVPNLLTNSYKDDDTDLDDMQKYLKKYEPFKFIVLWDKDLDMGDEEPFKVTKLPNPVKVKQLNESLKSELSLKPVSPMTILYLHSVSFIRTQKSKDSISKVGLFIRKKPLKNKKRNIEFIDPENGEIEEIDYEELADRIGDHKIDENIKNIGDTSLQQIICVCLDTSISMGFLLSGRSKKLKKREPSRKELSIIFLKSLMKRIHDFMIPTARGLILFGKEIIDKCPISIAERDFDEAVEDIKLDGTTPLWDTIDQAADKIIEFNHPDGGKKCLYPKARARIILLSDVDDSEFKLRDEASSKKIYSIVEKLVKNRIVMDIIMISTAEECRDALVASKITGGLCFRPQNEEQGIELFENEAFIDINSRATYNPIEGKIDRSVFSEQNKKIEKKTYTAPSEIENRLIKQCTVKAELSSVDYTLFYRKDERYQPKSICDRYIVKQLYRIRKNPNPDIVVYTFQKELKKWRVFIKGPERSPFAGGWWNLFINFPPNYPNSPPEFRFISVPYHQNVSGEGLLMFTEIAYGYDPAHKMNEILNKIQELLKKPDNVCLLRESIAIERNTDDDEYKTKAKASKNARSCDDYHEYLEGVTVNEDIPEDGLVDDDEKDNESIFMTVTDSKKKIRRVISDDDDDLIDT